MALGAFWRSPFSDIASFTVSHQWYGECADMEMKVIGCLEAYGLTKGIERCDTLIKDFEECANQDKQIKRNIAMRTERLRQYRDGERSKEELYAKPPRPDSI